MWGSAWFLHEMPALACIALRPGPRAARGPYIPKPEYHRPTKAPIPLVHRLTLLDPWPMSLVSYPVQRTYALKNSTVVPTMNPTSNPPPRLGEEVNGCNFPRFGGG